MIWTLVTLSSWKAGVCNVGDLWNCHMNITCCIVNEWMRVDGQYQCKIALHEYQLYSLFCKWELAIWPSLKLLDILWWVSIVFTGALQWWKSLDVSEDFSRVLYDKLVWLVVLSVWFEIIVKLETCENKLHVQWRFRCQVPEYTHGHYSLSERRS